MAGLVHFGFIQYFWHMPLLAHDNLPPRFLAFCRIESKGKFLFTDVQSKTLSHDGYLLVGAKLFIVNPVVGTKPSSEMRHFLDLSAGTREIFCLGVEIFASRACVRNNPYHFLLRATLLSSISYSNQRLTQST